MHLKRSGMPKSWPVARKSTKKRYIAVPNHAKKRSITLLSVMRDLLKVVNTRKEVGKILYNGDVKINGIVRKDDASPVQVFDTISLEKSKKYYRLEIVNKKFKLIDIKEKEVDEKVVKVIGKKVLSKDQIQINLEDGSNILSKDSIQVGDSIVFSQKNKKIVKVLPLKKGSKIEVIAGKHAGQKGELVGIEKLTRGKDYKIKFEDGHEVNLPYKTILVIG